MARDRKKRIDLFICLPKTERRCLFILLLLFYAIRREYVESAAVRHLFLHVRVQALCILSDMRRPHEHPRDHHNNAFVHQTATRRPTQLLKKC